MQEIYLTHLLFYSIFVTIAEPDKPPAGIIPHNPTITPDNQTDPRLQVRDRKYRRHLRRVKRAARSELDYRDWARYGYRGINFWIDSSRDTVTRVDYEKCSVEEFRELYETPALPVVITGAMEDWKAKTEWTPERLGLKYFNEKFKVGEDDESETVYMRFKDFIHYTMISKDAHEEDSPLYIFDGNFGERSKNNTADRINRGSKKDKEDEEKGEEEVDGKEKGTREVETSKPVHVDADVKMVSATTAMDTTQTDGDQVPDITDRYSFSPSASSGKSSEPPLQPSTESSSKPAIETQRERIVITLPTPKSFRSNASPTTETVNGDIQMEDDNQVDESHPTKEMLKDYKVPKYFTDDLFQYTGSRRPPYRWVVIGPGRSGTGIHVDPLNTAAWNALVFGHKRWALFPSSAPKSMVDPRGLPDHEAATWFAHVYPYLYDESTRDPTTNTLLAERLGIIEILQKPGEIVFVPGGWHHVVINLDFTVAVTHNFCSRANFEAVWLMTRDSRPRLAKKLVTRLDTLSMMAGPTANEFQREHGKVFAELVKKTTVLEMVPRLPPSSSDSSSSGSSSSGSSDEDGEGFLGDEFDFDPTESESSDEEGRWKTHTSPDMIQTSIFDIDRIPRLPTIGWSPAPEQGREDNTDDDRWIITSNKESLAIPTWGINLGYLIELVKACGGRESFTSLTTANISSLLVKPLTSDHQNSVCEVLIDNKRYDAVQPAN
ncbi:hypothetical protein HDU76_008308, partial [Blyttiomyces sp. JEL0837]